MTLDNTGDYFDDNKGVRYYIDEEWEGILLEKIAEATGGGKEDYDNRELYHQFVDGLEEEGYSCENDRILEEGDEILDVLMGLRGKGDDLYVHLVLEDDTPYTEVMGAESFEEALEDVRS